MERSGEFIIVPLLLTSAGYSTYKGYLQLTLIRVCMHVFEKAIDYTKSSDFSLFICCVSVRCDSDLVEKVLQMCLAPSVSS